MRKARVSLWSTPQKFVTVDPDATAGAVLGENLRNPDGSLVTPAQFVAESAPAPKVARTLWELVLKIPATVRALATATGTGLFVVTGSATGAFREIQPTIGRTTISNGDGVAGDPTVDLAVVPDSGTGAALVKLTRDAYGRVSGTEAADTDDLGEGAANLYFTDARAIHATMAPYEVADGDVFSVPTGKQCLFALPIDLIGSGALDVSGALVEVA